MVLWPAGQLASHRVASLLYALVPVGQMPVFCRAAATQDNHVNKPASDKGDSCMQVKPATASNNDQQALTDNETIDGLQPLIAAAFD